MCVYLHTHAHIIVPLQDALGGLWEHPAFIFTVTVSLGRCKKVLDFSEICWIPEIFLNTPNIPEYPFVVSMYACINSHTRVQGGMKGSNFGGCFTQVWSNGFMQSLWEHQQHAKHNQMKCKLALGSHCSGNISANSTDSRLFHLFASKKTSRMEVYDVISEAGAQMIPLSKECMINLRIFACSSVLNLQNWFGNRKELFNINS